VQSVILALEPDGGVHGNALSELPGVIDSLKMGDKWRLYTEDPSALLPELMAYAESKNLRIISLNTLAPSLEDVYLQITGGKLGTEQEKPDNKHAQMKKGRR